MSAPYNGADVPGYMLSPGYGASAPCPLPHVYLDRERDLLSQAVGATGRRRASLVKEAALQRRKAYIELAKCHPHPGYGAYGGTSCHPGDYWGRVSEGEKPWVRECPPGHSPAVTTPYNVQNDGHGYTHFCTQRCRPVGKQWAARSGGRRRLARLRGSGSPYGFSPFIPAAAALGGATILALMLVPTFVIGPWAVKQFKPKWPYGQRLVTSFLAGSAIAITRAAVVGRRDEEAKLGAMYGNCGIPGGCPTCGGDHAYGGCGTFMRITRDPDKKACLLEKDIARLEKKCAKGRKRKCEKLAKKEAELAAIGGSAYAPETLTTATDLQMAQWQQEEEEAATLLAQEQAKTQRTLVWAAIGGTATLLLVGALRRRAA